jgi:uncharacterized membrane protein YdfJ with MMPL/SSD domain
LVAFSGFKFGSFVGLQEFGVGLAAAILLDATVVRMVLVPATMKLSAIGTGTYPTGSVARFACRRRPRSSRRALGASETCIGS